MRLSPGLKLKGDTDYNWVSAPAHDGDAYTYEENPQYEPPKGRGKHKRQHHHHPAAGDYPAYRPVPLPHYAAP